MAYVLMLLSALAAFVLLTPAHDGVGKAIADGTRALMSTVASQSMPFERQIKNLGHAAREKGMELLREQIHKAVDEEVR